MNPSHLPTKATLIDFHETWPWMKHSQVSFYPKPHSLGKCSSFLGTADMGNCQIMYYKRLKRYFIIPTPQNKSEPTTPINTCKSGLLWIWLAAVILLNLSTMATLGTEKTDCCREVYTRVNVWTVRQKSDRCTEIYTRVNVWTVHQKSDRCREV